MRHYLTQLIESLIAGHTHQDDVPDVVIVEDLHLATSLTDLLSPLSHLDSSDPAVQFPYLIATTGPLMQSTTNVQLQYNLRYSLTYKN